MKINYKIKRKKHISVFKILFILILIIVTMGLSYARYSGILNIIGTATLELEEEPPLNIVVPPSQEDEEGDPIQYTSDVNFSNGFANVVELVSETMTDNHLNTTIKIIYRPLFLNPTISLGFTMTNSSKYSLTNGNVTLYDSQYSTNGISSVSPSLSLVTVPPGESSTFQLSFLLRARNVSSTSYLTYDIVYELNGIPRHFFYTITILPYGS